MMRNRISAQRKKEAIVPAEVYDNGICPGVLDGVEGLVGWNANGLILDAKNGMVEAVGQAGQVTCGGIAG
jgi:hypothetical protein